MSTMSDVLPSSNNEVLPTGGPQGGQNRPQNQAALERLRQRMEGYRDMQSSRLPEYDQTLSYMNSQQIQETLVLRQKFLESKAKKPNKKTSSASSAAADRMKHDMAAANNSMNGIMQFHTGGPHPGQVAGPPGSLNGPPGSLNGPSMGHNGPQVSHNGPIMGAQNGPANMMHHGPGHNKRPLEDDTSNIQSDTAKRLNLDNGSGVGDPNFMKREPSPMDNKLNPAAYFGRLGGGQPPNLVKQHSPAGGPDVKPNVNTLKQELDSNANTAPNSAKSDSKPQQSTEPSDSKDDVKAEVSDLKQEDTLGDFDLKDFDFDGMNADSLQDLMDDLPENFIDTFDFENNKITSDDVKDEDVSDTAPTKAEQPDTGAQCHTVPTTASPVVQQANGQPSVPPVSAAPNAAEALKMMAQQHQQPASSSGPGPGPFPGQQGGPGPNPTMFNNLRPSYPVPSSAMVGGPTTAAAGPPSMSQMGGPTDQPTGPNMMGPGGPMAPQPHPGQEGDPRLRGAPHPRYRLGTPSSMSNISTTGPGPGLNSHTMMGANQRMPQMGGNSNMMPNMGTTQPTNMGPTNMQMMNQQQMHPGMAQGMHPQQMAMMRMRMQQQQQQQQGMMRMGEPMPNMMPNGAGMEMMQGPNGMMMRGGPSANMPGMQRGGMGPGMMQGGGQGMMGPGMNMQGGMMGPGHLAHPGHPAHPSHPSHPSHPAHPAHPAMQHGMAGGRPPPPEYGMSPQGQQMPYMMSQMGGMGPGPNMRMPGTMGPTGRPGPGGPQVVRNQGMQQIPPSGPMMRHQNPLGDRMKMPGQMPPNMMMMGGMGGPAMKQGQGPMGPTMMGPGVMGPRGPIGPGHPGMPGANSNMMGSQSGWPNPSQPNLPGGPGMIQQGPGPGPKSGVQQQRHSPGVQGPGPSPSNPNMNPRIPNMGSMQPTMPGSPNQPSGDTGPGVPSGPGSGQVPGGAPGVPGGRHNVRGPGPANFPGNMQQSGGQMNPQMSMTNVRMPGMGPAGQRPMGPGMPSGQKGIPPGQHPGMVQHNMPLPSGHSGQHNMPQPGQHNMSPSQHNMPQPGSHMPAHHSMSHNSPLNTVPPSPHMVPQSPLSQGVAVASPMSQHHNSPHPNMSPATHTPTHQPSSREDFNLDFLENISPPTTKSQNAPNDQELLNLFS